MHVYGARHEQVDTGWYIGHEGSKHWIWDPDRNRISHQIQNSSWRTIPESNAKYSSAVQSPRVQRSHGSKCSGIRHGCTNREKTENQYGRAHPKDDDADQRWETLKWRYFCWFVHERPSKGQNNRKLGWFIGLNWQNCHPWGRSLPLLCCSNFRCDFSGPSSSIVVFRIP